MEIYLIMKNLFGKKIKKNYEQFSNYWVQKVVHKRKKNRFAFFEEYCRDKKVIHFGCTDWPIFDPNENLHIKLNEITNILHGFDIDKEGIENLKKYVSQDYFSDFKDVNENYDVCLIPETIEHVDNVRTFLENVSKIKSKIFLITAPNCFSKEHLRRNFYGEDYFIEVVHPDHNCWYSPYTLKNQIEKYSELKVIDVILLEDDKMICCVAEKV